MTKLGVAQEQREKVISLVFGSDRLTSVESHVCSLLSFVRQSNVDIVAYLQEHIIPKFLNNFTVISGKNIAKHAWNNNNRESVNNLLKLSINWKPARVVDHTYLYGPCSSGKTRSGKTKSQVSKFHPTEHCYVIVYGLL